MNNRKILINCVAALGLLVLWGNLVRFFLPAEQLGAILETLDFATVAYVLVIAVFLACDLLHHFLKKQPRKN